MTAQRLYLRLAEDETQGPESDLPPDTLQRIAVPAALAPHVAHVLRYRESIPPGREVVEQVMPDGRVRLAIEADGIRVIGAAREAAIVRLSGRVDGWSITLCPGASLDLLGVPADEITGRVVELSQLWGAGRAGEWHERFIAANDDTARLQVLQAMLPAPDEGGHRAAARAWDWIAQAAAPASVRDVARAIGVGERRLQQLFRAEVGMSPRAALRLARFHGVLRALRRSPRPRWAELALEQGFSDQPHLANEFRKLSGMTPTDFAARLASRSSKTSG